MRHDHGAHKRLMLLATWVFASAARLGMSVPPVAVRLLYLGTLLSPLAYDLIKERRVHPANGWGIPAVFAFLALIRFFAPSHGFDVFANGIAHAFGDSVE